MKNDKPPVITGKTYTISIARANYIAIILMIPEALLLALPFFLIWGENVFTALKFTSFLYLLIFMVSGVLIHELLHGLTWAIVTGTGFMNLSFGIKWEYLTPYCHYKKEMKVWQYVAGGIMPLILMGLLPAVWALFNGNIFVMFFGIFYTWTAGGDIVAIWMVRQLKAGQLIYDHPEELGFIIKDT